MKIAVSTYSFAKWMQENNQLAIVKKAHDMGFEALSVSGIIPHDGSTKEEYAEKIRKEAEKYNIRINDYLFGADLAQKTEEETRKAIEEAKRQIDIAEILGVGLVRHDVAGGANCKSFDLALPALSAACREITEYAASKGIVTTIENHGFFCQDAERIERLYNAVNHENFGILCDIGNFLCVDEDPVMSVSRVAPYARNAHVKDFHFRSGKETHPGEGYFQTRGCNYIKGTIVGHGVVPTVQCLAILKRAGYDGYVCIEFEGPEDNLEALRISHDNLKRFISMI
ncbi:MAG: sugar phosphate isomerase/epimerase [Oscillospiraceae bacterium]|nr:sugar phosphate isomerase/epimerase [Oscillospiraceae bacterium]